MHFQQLTEPIARRLRPIDDNDLAPHIQTPSQLKSQASRPRCLQAFPFARACGDPMDFAIATA
jgi:hypothetical protein